jgi:hypothetical protein
MLNANKINMFDSGASNDHTVSREPHPTICSFGTGIFLPIKCLIIPKMYFTFIAKQRLISVPGKIKKS